MKAATFLDPRLVAEDPAEVRINRPIHLAASRCLHCDRVDFPAREACSACQHPVASHRLSSDAVLTGATAVLHAPPGAKVQPPYYVGVATFAEGIAVMGLLLAGSLEEVPLGSPVQVVAIEVADSLTYAFAAL